MRAHAIKPEPATALRRHANELARLDGLNLRRRLERTSGADFTSNDFLGFNVASPVRQAVRDAIDEGVPVGSGGSRLLRGNHPAHEKLESQAAEFFGSEKSLFFASGYIANYALLTSLPKRGDLIAFDSLAHASAREGIHASLAKSVKFPHNDMEALARSVESWKLERPASCVWIYAESLYSMDGDFAPLPELLEIADRHDAMAIIDEAHATGVWGERGGGLTEPYCEKRNLIALHTCGKALGVSGALACAAAEIIDVLIATSRPFIYSTAPSPLTAIAVSSAIELLKESADRRDRLRRLIRFSNARLLDAVGVAGSGSQIIPVVIGDAEKALAVARAMQDSGYDVRAIRPPTVAEGTARLRLSITLHVSETQVQEMLDVLKHALEALA